MTDRTFILSHNDARRRCAEYAMTAEAGSVVKFGKPRKSRAQEERYHAMIGDIAKQLTHAGRSWSAEDMKRLLVDAFRNDTKDDPELAEEWKEMGHFRMAPSIGRDGFVVLGYPTKKFPKKLASAFIDWLFAFGAENGVSFIEDLPAQGERVTA